MKREFIDVVLPPSRKYIQAFATDNLYLPADYIKSLSEEKDTVRRQRLFEGNWDYDEDQDSLITYDALSDAFTNTIVKDGQKYLIVDVARMGKDTTTFNYWDGMELYKIEQFSKQDTQNTIQKLKDTARIEHIPYSHIMIDEDGIGGAVVDGLLGVRGFIANSRPIPTRTEIISRIKRLKTEFTPVTNYANLKSQCAFKLAEMINEHKISFNVLDYREAIMEEAAALLKHKKIDSDGKLQIKPKNEVKEELGRSPDIGDPLIYRMWFVIKEDALNEAEKNEILEKQSDLLNRNKANVLQNSNK